ncbi:uncharacterized protein J8A68_005612 [[Candida] subhashii]|uniref:DUF3835 domain-containing protein n=1 Tax=[Candida] subhashii TaxID=561895 RepID=A0A8J5QGB9_9ASCO|nr:uncharacterized protein J8A68_005612 [[Candida] subhashii]KAG7660937.1 hypothetical protein J8A68_005612 [[Candida] subhashii]
MNGTISESEYADVLTNQITRTINNLQQKLDILKNQINDYKLLQKSIASQTPPILIHLGEGYFVEKNVEEANQFLYSRIQLFTSTIQDIETKINEAKSTREKFIKFAEFTKEMDDSQAANEDEGQNKFNEEGLPFLDIQEEIDEDGHVLNVKINDIPVDISESSTGVKISEEKESKNQQEVETVISGNSQEVSTTPANHIQKDKHILPTPKEDIPKQQDKIQFVEESLEDEPTYNGRTSDKQNQQDEEVERLEDLLHDMELAPKKTLSKTLDQDELLNKIDQLHINPEEKFNLKQICIEEINKLEGDEQPKESATNEIAIDQSDMIELEILADEFDDSMDSNMNYADDEEWEFEFDEDEDEDEDDDELADALLYGGGENNLPNHAYGLNQDSNNLLWKQIMKLRQGNLKPETEPPITIESIKQKKSVRFAETLDIKEVENISETLRNPPRDYDDNGSGSKMSLFKQNIIMKERLDHKMEVQDSNVAHEDELLDSRIVESEILERDPVIEDLIIEKEIVERIPVNEDTIIEKEIVESIPVNEDTIIEKQIVESIPVMEGSIMEKGIFEKIPTVEDRIVENDSIEREPVMSDSIIENDIIESNDFPGNSSNAIIHDKIVENQPKDIAVSKITDADSIIVDNLSESQILEANPPANTSKPISRFQASRIQSHIPPVKIPIPCGANAVPVPETDPESSPKQSNDEDQSGQEIRETRLDYQSLTDDLDTMAKAYVLGMYDDDIVTEGPVVDKIDDFEILNKMLESMPSKDESTNRKISKPKTANDYDSNLSEIGMDGGIDSDEEGHEMFENDHDEEDEDDGSILVDEIVENENVEVDNDELENEIFLSEINENYHRLRNKLILERNGYKKSQKELEFEPIDEDGNDIKVSRFKAARLRHLPDLE